MARIVDILGIDPRIGSGGMRPGIGYGGGCLPKDVRAFTASARQLGADRVADLLLVDCRTALDPEPWRTAGWTVHQLGRPGK
ncbi:MULTISPECIES: hypothetical protein [unclassified Streptomyces]|uniref:hypothetical protein n=1 Tax=unclassified Streptomyces TaxID=2593676 RepID=UPI00362C4F82